MIFFKGLSVMQAAELKGITGIELKINMRMDLQKMHDKIKKAWPVRNIFIQEF